MTVREYPSLSMAFFKILEPGISLWTECTAYIPRAEHDIDIWEYAWSDECRPVASEGTTHSDAYTVTGGVFAERPHIMSLSVRNLKNYTWAKFELEELNGAEVLSRSQSPPGVLDPNDASDIPKTKRLMARGEGGADLYEFKGHELVSREETTGLEARGKKGADPYEIKGHELVFREETKSLAVRGDREASPWTLDAMNACSERSCSYMLKIREGDGSEWTTCNLFLPAGDHPDARRKSWSGQKCENPGNRNPESQVYVLDGEYDVDGRALVVTVANEERKLVADFEFTAQQLADLPARMGYYRYYPSKVKVKAEPHALDTPKMRGLMAREETSLKIRENGDDHTWTLGTRTMCSQAFCLYFFDIYYDSDDSNKDT